MMKVFLHLVHLTDLLRVLSQVADICFWNFDKIAPGSSIASLRRWRPGVFMMVKQLAAALSNAQEYINLAAKAEDGGERERYERIAELCLKITPRLAARG